MGPPRTKAPRPTSHSRFFEGSMKDRASAVPPVQFLGPEERAAMQQPVPVRSSTSDEEAPPARQLNHKKSRLLGQVWDGVRGRLGFRRPAGEETTTTTKKKPAAAAAVIVENDAPTAAGNNNAGTTVRDDMPSREEILENYQHLVASGFFSSHAIQSTRRPPPGASSRPATPHQTHDSTHLSQRRINMVSEPTEIPPVPPVPPHWPLPAPERMPPTPNRSTVGAGHPPRGTKRSAASDPDDDPVVMNETTPKKLRKSVSRDIIALPKLRSVASRRNVLSRRSPPNVKAEPVQREQSRLTKRVLTKKPGHRGAAPSTYQSDISLHRSPSRRECSDAASMQALWAS
ncbi:hypothetical protein S40288_06393 [Stachybotrys chartarum IBT 40288]|nr:hypothetical protein S40288_06393 [Stachybotrys chartarum IBT 40288]